jgi:hypothetical protein
MNGCKNCGYVEEKIERGCIVSVTALYEFQQPSSEVEYGDSLFVPEGTLGVVASDEALAILKAHNAAAGIDSIDEDFAVVLLSGEHAGLIFPFYADDLVVRHGNIHVDAIE